jgi:uncharacterized membrane protein
MTIFLAILVGVLTNVMGYPVLVPDELGEMSINFTNLFILFLCELLLACIRTEQQF